jgi:hypothetical protein
MVERSPWPLVSHMQNISDKQSLRQLSRGAVGGGRGIILSVFII